ncbi:MAG: ribonuclease HII [bacterium]|nr:ribonuclease HII [bacterium]
MKYPTFQEEKILWKKGYKKVVGLDEAGRGALCGPVVAAAVVIKSSFKFQILGLEYLKDSKKLTAKKREEFYKILTNHPQIKWGIGRVSEKVIDKINILEATKLAMIKAIKKLKRKPDFLIIDGNFKLNLPIPQKSIIKADEKVFSVALASIIAKVYRDRIMRRYHKKYLQYGFDKHKGYPTKQHRKMLKKHGPCQIHRKTFKPVRSCKSKDYLLS